MKTPRCLFLLLLAALLTFVPAIPVRAEDPDEEVSFDYFYDNLKPYGDWVEVADYGLCWHPNDVSEDWAPYTDGYWSYTDAGWTWVSYEDFGGIVYHYGRWVRVEDEGWCWVPDTDWAPAWVSWRNNDDYVGWAPLPPEARFKPEVGLSVWVDDTYDIGPDNYRFCRVRDFGAPVIREVCLPRERNVVIVRQTVNVTNITVNNGFGGAYCGGPRYDYVSRHSTRPIPALVLVRQNNVTNIANINTTNNTVNVRNDNRRITNSVQRGNTLVVAAPRIRPAANGVAPLPNVRPARTLQASQVQRGWGSRAPQERDALRQAMRKQNKGATPVSAPARPVTSADLKVVPKQADPTAILPAAGGRNRPPGRGPARAPQPPAVPPVAIPGIDEPPALVKTPPVVPPPATPSVARGKNRTLPGRPPIAGEFDKTPAVTPPVTLPPAVPPVAPATPASLRGKRGRVAPAPIAKIPAVPSAPAVPATVPSETQPVKPFIPKPAATARVPGARPGAGEVDSVRPPGVRKGPAPVDPQAGAARQAQADRAAALEEQRQRAAENAANTKKQRDAATASAAAVSRQRSAAAAEAAQNQREAAAANAAAAAQTRQRNAAAAAEAAQERQRANAAANAASQQRAAAAAAQQRAAASAASEQRAAAAAANQQRAAAAANQQRATAAAAAANQQRAALAAAQQRAAAQNAAAARQRAVAPPVVTRVVPGAPPGQAVDPRKKGKKDKDKDD